jgi:hypothetical protein
MEEIGSGIFGSSPEPTFYGNFLDSSSKKSQETVNEFRKEQ